MVKTERKAERRRPSGLIHVRHVRSKTEEASRTTTATARSVSLERHHRRIGEIPREDARFEEAYEGVRGAASEFVIEDFCAGGVLMEIATVLLSPLMTV